ncbi:MAG: hypothetical protein COW00_06205 [Bdellovibrio sp. CG12_big_fil_rev_8_21_14_0_65_39_13]|nr:MAG: hypothetical protein COW78_18740 [Bdellovibrio sp. CG22_combo_CG10-13_8_21_14_all_39_27]PIQ60815.1 MAG: hypothetical protein COW00_06205 [Bdellovibrio sp. CG12_big_fil_rev_8_21_14_0_65_39_13]PIR36439.1 MAG: hypothetical protein COV37_03545 [Bdellovibrio sp. CG11_big_fil_rev_8_21_14_0_20_39_38]PJB54665.1 MAG: hypothetical protein CO099_00335 [Bdellovibrio sp. CG_4_9_14_3_um_filter_39_7]
MSKIALQSLHLLNFATFENQEIIFGDHFNCIVGETGSGKSLILTAFMGLLGNKLDKKSVRRDADSAVIQGIFKGDSKSIQRLNEDGYPCEDDNIIIKRVIQQTGTSKTYVNGLICSSTYLNNFIREYVDLVGQFENQKLLSPEYQLQLLDIYAGTEEELRKYKSELSLYKELNLKLSDLKNRQSTQKEREEFLRYQLEEFDSANLSVDEERELQAKKDFAFNLEKNRSLFGELAQIAIHSENSISSYLPHCLKVLNSLKGVDPKLHQSFSDFKIHFEEFSDLLLENSQLLEVDSNIDEIMNRIDTYQKIKRKHGPDIEEVILKLENYRTELNELDNISPLILKIEKELKNSFKKCSDLAQMLHDKRELSAKKLAKLITQLIQSLNMEGATLDIRLERSETFLDTGITKVEFWTETNKGEGFYPIKQIASGGELSRILLCLRQVVANKDSISIFFFDEIDTGIGGETALKIGKLLSEISRSSQVISITHLPQIAHNADHIVLVSKDTMKINGDTRTLSTAKFYEGPARKQVIESMIAIGQDL